jgi:hypothetical protein
MLLLYKQKSLEQTVEQMRRMGEMLIPYNYPMTPKSEAEDIAPFKLNQIMLDGYEIYVQYNKGNYGKYFLESVEVIAKNTPFLPFVLVCKVGKAFLGDKYLAYVSFWDQNRNHYVWTVAKDEDDQPMPGPYKVEMETYEYEGFEYDVFPKKGGISFH